MMLARVADRCKMPRCNHTIFHDILRSRAATMAFPWLFALAISFIHMAAAVGSPYQLVTSEATCRAGKPLATYLLGTEEDRYATVGVVDFCADSATTSINKVFSTNFKGDNAGIAMEISKDNAILLSKFDSMFSANFCGCKAAEYFGEVVDSLCVVLPETDLEDTLEAHDQFFRRILAKLSACEKTEQRMPFVFLINSSRPVQQTTVNQVTNFIESIWKDIGSLVSCTKHILYFVCVMYRSLSTLTVDYYIRTTSMPWLM